MAASKSPCLRLLHMRDEIESLSQELAGLSFESYRNSYGLRRITERAIQIVSEAAKELPQEVRALEPDVPWPEIIGIGNLLRHEYYRIKTSEIKAILTEHLPRLRPAIVRLLAKFEP